MQKFFKFICFLSGTDIKIPCQHPLISLELLILSLEIVDFSLHIDSLHTLHLLCSSQMVWMHEMFMSAHFQE